MNSSPKPPAHSAGLVRCASSECATMLAAWAYPAPGAKCGRCRDRERRRQQRGARS